MIFKLNYGATLAALPASAEEPQATRVDLSIECPKSAPDAAECLIERLRPLLIHQYYLLPPEQSDALSLIGIKGTTTSTPAEIVTELHVYYFPPVSTFISTNFHSHPHTSWHTSRCWARSRTPPSWAYRASPPHPPLDRGISALRRPAGVHVPVLPPPQSVQ